MKLPKENIRAIATMLQTEKQMGTMQDWIKSAFQGKSKQVEGNASSNQHQEWSTIKRDSATGRIVFVEGNGRTNSTIEDWRNIEFFSTPQGEVLGFVDKEGNIYLDETKIIPEHPIHEYTLLWDRASKEILIYGIEDANPT